MLRVLMIGAGAVGQVFGHHLQQGGAALTFYVLPQFRESMQKGCRLYRLGYTGAKALDWKDYEVVSSVDEVREREFDQIWLAVPSTALSGDWIENILKAASGATIVSLLPGVEDLAVLSQWVPKERIVTGMISIIAYQAPLPGETRFKEPGIAFWLPPLAPSPFDGPRADVQQVVQTLTSGGQAAVYKPNYGQDAATGNGAFMPMLAVLERADWKLAALQERSHAQQVVAAMREAVIIVAARLGIAPPVAARLSPWMIQLVAWLAPKFTPLDLETYLKYHFTKVGDQTRLYLQQFIAMGKERQLPTAELERALNALPPLLR
jgi:ketopantoate reductase